MYSFQAVTQIRASDNFHCPFIDEKQDICSASLSSIIIGPQNRHTRCSSENYDNCPIFLAKLLIKNKIR